MKLDKEGSTDYPLFVQGDVGITYHLYLGLFRLYYFEGNMLEILSCLIDNLVSIDIGDNLSFFLVELSR